MTTLFAPWPGPPSPISGGTAMRLDAPKFGTVGVALTIDGDGYFTASYHVAPAPDAGERNVSLLRPSGSFEPTDRLTASRQLPRLGLELEGLDTTFLRAASPVTNGFPDFIRVEPRVTTPGAGELLQYKGCRDDAWRSCAYGGTFDAGVHQGDYDPQLDFGSGAFAVVDLHVAPYDPDLVQGDSGTVLWANRPLNGRACVGHIVAVSLDPAVPRAVIVLYERAFDRMGLSDSYRIL